MGYLNTYRSRLNANGSNSMDSIVQGSKQTVKNNFSNSLFSEVVLIDDVEYEVIVTQEKLSENKKILLHPDTKIDIGATVKIKELPYLVMDFLGDGINEVYPTATLRLCNSTFPIESNNTSVLIGTDSYGRPVYSDQSTVTNTPCIVETKYYFNNRNEQITLPEDRMLITMQYQDAPNIEVGKEFEMYKSRFKITHFDFSKVINGKGVMVFTGERVMDK